MSSSQVHVRVTKFGRKNLAFRWTDPETGQRVAKSAGTSNRREAERRAAFLEKELREGKYAVASRTSWLDFTIRYTEEVLPGRAPKTRDMLACVFNAVERISKPQRLADLTAARLQGFQAVLRREGRAEATIKTYQAHLQASLKWGVKVGLLPSLPGFPEVLRAPKGSKVMKGRPVTGEEFDRMLAVVPVAVFGKPGKDAPEPAIEEVETVGRVVASWRHLLRGLWWSGLRLGEALCLRWDAADGAGEGVVVWDVDGRRPMLRIHAEAEKGHRERLLPMAPEFARFLLATPAEDRRGRVFHPLNKAGRDSVWGTDWVSRVVCKIGERAGVVVNRTTKVDRQTRERREVVKYASAHDLRRSFGVRWSARLMPAQLQELMRHESIDTTMKYYVGRNAEATADALWAAFDGAERAIGNTNGNHPPAEGALRVPQETKQALVSQGLR